MQRIKIFRKGMEDAGDKSFLKVENNVNDWLAKNEKYTVTNMFSANMFSDYGDGDFVLIVLYTDRENKLTF
jgi:hypothetical protein